MHIQLNEAEKQEIKSKAYQTSSKSKVQSIHQISLIEIRKFETYIFNTIKTDLQMNKYFVCALCLKYCMCSIELLTTYIHQFRIPIFFRMSQPILSRLF